MAIKKALPVLCFLFLFFTSSIVLPSTEAARTLEESKAEIGYGTITGSHPSPPHTGRGCAKNYYCGPPGSKP